MANSEYSISAQHDELGAATDRLVATLKALVPEDKHDALDAFGSALSDWCAVIIGRATAQSAGAVLAFAEPQHKELKAQRKRQDRARVDIADLQTRLDDHSQRLTALELGGRNAGD